MPPSFRARVPLSFYAAFLRVRGIDCRSLKIGTSPIVHAKILLLKSASSRINSVSWLSWSILQIDSRYRFVPTKYKHNRESRRYNIKMIPSTKSPANVGSIPSILRLERYLFRPRQPSIIHKFRHLLLQRGLDHYFWADSSSGLKFYERGRSHARGACDHHVSRRHGTVRSSCAASIKRRLPNGKEDSHQLVACSCRDLPRCIQHGTEISPVVLGSRLLASFRSYSSRIPARMPRPIALKNQDSCFRQRFLNISEIEIVAHSSVLCFNIVGGICTSCCKFCISESRNWNLNHNSRSNSIFLPDTCREEGTLSRCTHVCTQ